MRILVVDDDYVSRTKIKALLADYGDCDGATDGALALEMFRKAHEEHAPYELITLDIGMPGMDGKATLQAMRQWEDEHQCFENKCVAKILMVTIMKDRESIMSSFRDSCDGYLIKPVTPDNIKGELEKLEIGPLEKNS